MKTIADIVTDKDGAKDKAFADGLHVGGERFVMARAEDGTIYARKVRIPAIYPPIPTSNLNTPLSPPLHTLFPAS